MATPPLDLTPPAQGIEGTGRYIALFGGMLAVMLIMSLAVGPLQSLRGVAGPTIALATHPVLAGLIVLGTFAVSFFIALLVGKAINAVVGLFVLGSGLAVLSMQCGTISDLIFGGGGFVPLVLEGVVWAVVVLVAAAMMFRFAGPLADIPVRSPSEAMSLHAIFSSKALKSALAGVIVIPVIWLLLFNDLKGQAIAATTVGALLAGMVGRLLSPRTQPVLLFAAPVVFGALGYAIAMTMLAGSAQEMFVANTLPRLARPMPMDFAAGALMGVAIGLGWSRSFVESDTGGD